MEKKEDVSKEKVFEDYAPFYDSIYKDKDYLEECIFIRKIFDDFSSSRIKSILDLGCGTGSHAKYLAEMGYHVTGIDRSARMLKIAKDKTIKNTEFIQGDISNFDRNKKIDAVVAMFAVMSYLTVNEDIENTLKTVKNHLKPEGLFVFDVWFGPAVLTQKPTDRVKIIEQGDKKIIRYAHPVLDIVNHTVEVNYTVLEIARNKVLTETKESHLMRFFFYQELKYFLEKNEFEVLKICPFMDLDGQVNEGCWNITIICKTGAQIK